MKDVTTRENLARINNILAQTLDEFNITEDLYDRTNLSGIIFNLSNSIDSLECAMEESEGEGWRNG